MRSWPFLLVVGIAVQAPAANRANRLSIDEFERLLAAVHGQSDGRVAHQLAGHELTERASSPRLARWETEFSGRRCREALTEIADASAFLDLPASDLPALPAPDSNAQQAMLARTLNYAAQTMTRLPNFYATRTTQHFEDTPAHETMARMNMSSSRGLRPGAWPAVVPDEVDYRPMHLTGVSSVTVTYRNGNELGGSKPLDAMSATQPAKVLTTAGEFGPVLGMVLGDTRQSPMTWAHWEKGPNGVEAVFRYSVPQEQAHYVVRLPRGGRIEQYRPAYHGEIAIDPANGDVIRISVVAQLAPPNDRDVTAIVVEYGTVTIGEKPYACPVKSIAISKTPVADALGASVPMQTQLNDVAFTGYHLFRAEARVLTGTGVESGDGAAAEERAPGK